MSLRETLSNYLYAFQQELFPRLEKEIAPLSGRYELFVAVVELVRLETLLPSMRSLPGRPPQDRAALARAFIAKAAFDIPTTGALIERLRFDRTLYRLCGFSSALPSEATFSRGFAEFADSALAGRLHQALIAWTVKDHLVGHISRDATAIAGREKPLSKVPGALRGKRQRGQPRKGEQRPKEATRLQRRLTMSLSQMLDDLSKSCDVGARTNARGVLEKWVGCKLHVDAADGGVPRKFQGQIIRDLTGHNSRLKDAFDEHVLKRGPRFSRRRRLALALRLFEAWSDAVRVQGILFSAQDLAIKGAARLRLTILGTGNIEVVPATVWLDHKRLRKIPPGTPAEIPAKRRLQGAEYRRMGRPESRDFPNPDGCAGLAQAAQHHLRLTAPVSSGRKTPPGVRLHLPARGHKLRKHPCSPRLCTPSFSTAFKVASLSSQSLNHLQSFFVTALRAAPKVPQDPPEILRPPQHRSRLAIVSFALRSNLFLAPVEPHALQGHISRRLLVAPGAASPPRLRISGPPGSLRSAFSLKHNFDDAEVGK